MLKLLSTLFALTLTACSTPTKQNIDFTKLKPEDRVYAGIIQVELNGKTNPDLTCDMFLNSDIAPTVRVGTDGVFQFKSNRKSLAFSTIACIHKVKNKSYWVRHKLGIPRISKSEDSKAREVTDLGTLTIKWTVEDSEVQNEKDVMITKDEMRDIGKIQVTQTRTDEIKPPSPNL